jgi:prevent-host-death family protein
MEPVSVRELRQNLSIYLRRVEAGETLRVLRRGEPVAVLAPLPGRRTAIDWLIAERGASRPTRRVADLPKPIRLEGAKTISEALAEQREERLRPS